LRSCFESGSIDSAFCVDLLLVVGRRAFFGYLRWGCRFSEVFLRYALRGCAAIGGATGLSGQQPATDSFQPYRAASGNGWDSVLSAPAGHPALRGATIFQAFFPGEL